MTPDSDGIEELALAAAAGDGKALDALIGAIQPEVLRVCGRFLPNHEDAEEACQDALLAVAKGIARFDRRSAFRTWLYRIAANRARSTYQVLRQRFVESSSASLPEQPDPRRTSVVAGTRLDLLDGLEALGRMHSEPLALRDVVGLSYREIADLIGVPEGTVKSRVHEGRRRMQVWLIDRGT
jgi:RNA polymerase sigma factor (sigma-70 family)